MEKYRILKPFEWNQMYAIVWLLVMFTCYGLVSCSNRVSEKESGMVLTGDTPWIISEEQPEPVQRALDDVKSDWYKVFGRIPVVVKELPSSWKGPVIYLGIKGTWRASMVKEPFPGKESFILRIQLDDDKRLALVATGADIRGSIYAAYALSEEILGVDPWYYWVDKEPVPRNRIVVPEGFNKHYGPATFKYRGWFINDEDLLSGFAPDPLRENVFSLEMFDHIYETLLRLRGNMIVPSTFPFPDERCQTLAARRGLVLNMHHILVLGLNTYRWPKDVPFSFNKHQDIMEQYWQKCINAFKDYEAVWTVGYRGKFDNPFWLDDPELKTPEKRGEVITKAIAKQVEMLRKVHPDAAIISNLWSEGAELYSKGLIKLPEGVTIVWPDNGSGIIQDKGLVKAGQGIYFHTAMLNNRANQLSEMVNPARIYREVGRFIDANATEFFLVNVSDLRPVPLSTDCAMRLVWNSKPYIGKTDKQNMDNFLIEWSKCQFGSDASKQVSVLYQKYFDLPYMHEDIREGENSLATNLNNLITKTIPMVVKGELIDNNTMKQCQNLFDFTIRNQNYLINLQHQSESILRQIPSDRRNFFQSHLLTQVQIHSYLIGMLKSFCQSMISYNLGDKSDAIKNSEKVLLESDNLLSVLHKAEYGKFSCWYIGQRFIPLNESYDKIRVLLALLRNESPPPVRIKSVIYDEIYKYQEPFTINYPLLYPIK
jgi:hypothetical protein